ncbi:hypothetical protein EUGRSUZ_F04147 [Eucalyptus grandis]|uniref:Uncharacterized protein n=2 Tax=Eucalyptus grandis TaxID=71139 RepID=A0ACC3KP31_EUCGR|nr:hypothetical protein EUGRSUZ_F04147 [Eucalyptus grandis]
MFVGYQILKGQDIIFRSKKRTRNNERLTSRCLWNMKCQNVKMLRSKSFSSYSANDIWSSILLSIALHEKVKFLHNCNAY